MPPQPDPEKKARWLEEQMRRQARRFQTRRGRRPERKPKDKK